MRRDRLAHVTAIGAIGVAAAVLGGCAGAPTGGRTPTSRASDNEPPAWWGTTGSARERLARAATGERPRAFPADMDLADRLGLEPISWDDGDRARLPLASAIDDWRARLGIDEEATSGSARVAPEDRLAALDLLRASRGSDPETALRALDEAARLDPTEPAIPLEHFRVLHAAGRRVEAVGAARRAFGLGVRDPDVLLAVALDAGEGDARATLELLELIRSGDPIATDAGSLARIAGGESMLANGYARAGGRLLLEGLDALGEPSADSPWRRDIIRAIARADELRVRAGDALLASGDHEEASRAYAAAASTDGENGSARRRAVLALLLAGRRAGAASLVIESLSQTPRPPSVFDVEALGLAADSGDAVARLLSEAIVQTREEHAELGISYRDSMTMLAAELLGGRGGAELLRARLRDEPPRGEPARRFFERAPDLDEAISECVELTSAQPERARMWAAALLGGREEPAEIAAALERDASRAGRLLLAGVELQRQRPHEAFEVLRGVDRGEGAPDAALDRMLVEAGVASGHWDAAEAALARLRSDGDADPVLVLGALRIAQRSDEAYALGEELVSGREPTIEALLEMTELASMRSQAHDAELFLQLAGELDRYDERIYAARLMLYSPGGPLPDEAQQTAVLRELRQRLPESALARLHDAGDLASAGLYEEAEATLRRIGWEDPDQNAAFEMLLGIWDAKAQGDPSGAEALYERAGEWLGSVLDRRPASPAVGAALARVLVRLGRVDEAMGVIDRVEASVGARVLAPLREQFMERELGDREGALQHAIARLGRPTLSIDDAITRASLEIQSGRVGDAAETLAASLPDGVALTPDQGQRLIRTTALAIASLGADSESEDAEIEAYEQSKAPVVRLIQTAGDRVPLPDPIATQLLRLKAQDPGSTPESLSGLAEAHAGSDEEARVRAYQVILFELIGSRRFDAASRALALGAVARERLNADLLLAAAEVAGRFGEAEDLRAVIRTLDESGRAEQAGEIFRDDASDRERSPESVRAEIAYLGASQASFADRDGVAEEMYRIALEHDPRHMWSNNDLGYMLAEQGRDLEEAERLILIAYEAEPESSNVADSLGWVRYKLGRFEDEGGVEGAITLIRRSLSLEDGGDRATLHDHLGDALWRAGRRDEAERAWLDAEQVGLAQVRDARRQRPAEDPMRSRFESLLRAIRAKLLAVQAGEEPRVAPLPGENEAP